MENQTRRRREFPHTYVILFAVILCCAAATWFVPGGHYAVDGNGVAVFERVEAEPQTWQVFTALSDGFVDQAGIVVFILIIGGSFWIVNGSRAVEAGILSFLACTRKWERHRWLARVGVNNLVMVSVMLVFSLFGAVFGMSEETIAFVPLLIPLAVTMGYDSLVGICLVYVAAHVGFAGAFLNPFTVGIAQELAGLPLFSGIGYRIFCWAVLTAMTVVFVLVYAARVRRQPFRSPAIAADAGREVSGVGSGGAPAPYCNRSSWLSFGLTAAILAAFVLGYSGECRLNLGGTVYAAPWLLPAASAAYAVCSVPALRKSVHRYILVLLGFSMVFLVIGVLGYGWYLTEISALFLGLGLAAGIASGLSANGIVREFLAGAKDILSAAVVVGLAAGIIRILQEGRIIDTLLFALAESLDGVGETGSLGLMYGIQALINTVIPSASAKAAITMPVMAPFADLIGLSRQATVLAFQFGDGFTNMVTPTSGVLMAVLGLAKVPYAVWLKFIWRFVLLLLAAGFLLLLPTVFCPPSGF